jgi:molybdopterin-dependent oxidoreductase alpha subunit
VAAIATDTWGIEVLPNETTDVFQPLHIILLVNAGIHIGEMFDLEALADFLEQSGVTKVTIEDAARVFIESERVIFCWAMGLTQHKNAVANIQEIVNLMLLRGQLGKPGAGLCPVRGHSNVQGDRTMGIWEQPSEDFLDKLGQEFNFEPPRRHGLDTVHAIQAMHEGRAKVFFALGGNFLSATPDTEYTAEALRRCRLTAHVSTKLNRAHLITGKQALILPCIGRTEIDEQAGGPQFVTTENSMAVVEGWHGRLPPASDHLLSEPAIVAGLAKAVCSTNLSLSDQAIDWDGLISNYDRIRDAIEHVVPGFESYNERARQPGGFYLPNPIRKREFKTSDGRAHFTVHPLPQIELQAGQFLMMTMRSHDQFNTTIYGLDDRYRGIRNGRRIVFLNSEDIRLNGLQAGQVICLELDSPHAKLAHRCLNILNFPAHLCVRAELHSGRNEYCKLASPTDVAKSTPALFDRLKPKFFQIERPRPI